MAKNPAATRSTPDQQDVNGLAAFIEAAEELQREPFFRADDKSIPPKQGKSGETQFGDRSQFRSAQISFRRIWSGREASNFLEICRLIKHFEDGGPALETIQRQHKEFTERRWPNLPRSSGEIVDLWLTAVFAPSDHKGPKSERWQRRIEFDRLVKAHGHAFLENVCRTAMAAIGACYFGLLKITRPALARWEKDYGLRPQFEIGAPFGQSRAEATAAPAPVASKPLAESLGGEGKLQQFERILSLDTFKPLKAILDNMRLDRAVICAAANSANSYQDLMAKLGYTVTLAPQIHYQDCYSRVGPAGGIRAVLPHHDVGTHSTLVTLVNFNSTLTTTPKTAGFFNAKFAELKALLSK